MDLSRYILHICYSKEIPSEELVLKYCEMYIKRSSVFKPWAKESGLKYNFDVQFLCTLHKQLSSIMERLLCQCIHVLKFFRLNLPLSHNALTLRSVEFLLAID